MGTTSLLDYYQRHDFNAVPIELGSKEAWESQVIKRRNLYENHLGIPLSLLRGRSVLEFGCNSGENALVLAAAGANLTLVEPNGLVMPRLRELFNQFGLEDQITDLVEAGMEDFSSANLYDLVIAEGFINALDNREEMLAKMFSLLAPGGRVVISFDDSYGHFLELTKMLVFSRACRLEGIKDLHNKDSLALAQLLFLEDFTSINVSRPFAAWWEDVLLNPFVAADHLWNYQGIIPVLDQVNAEFHSSSPSWVSSERFVWYKNVVDRQDRHRELLDEWPKAFSFFLTGLPLIEGTIPPASHEVVQSVFDLTVRISDYIKQPDYPVSSVVYPQQLDRYLASSSDLALVGFNEDMKRLYAGIGAATVDELVEVYHGSGSVRSLWGSGCHYVCMTKAD